MHYKSNTFSHKSRLSGKGPYILVIEIVSVISLEESYIQRLECRRFEECIEISILAYDQANRLAYRVNHMKSLLS